MCGDKNKDWEAALITGAIALFIAIGGNYLLTTNKVSAMETKVDMYQQSIQELSDKMDKMNANQTIISNQLSAVIEQMKYKQDKIEIK